MLNYSRYYHHFGKNDTIYWVKRAFAHGAFEDFRSWDELCSSLQDWTDLPDHIHLRVKECLLDRSIITGYIVFEETYFKDMLATFNM